MCVSSMIKTNCKTYKYLKSQNIFEPLEHALEYGDVSFHCGSISVTIHFVFENNSLKVSRKDQIMDRQIVNVYIWNIFGKNSLG